MMAYSHEQLEDGAALFFRLLNEQIISISDPLAAKYRRDGELRNVVKTMAAEGGLRIFSTPQHLHLVSRSRGSNFANSYTQMKDKYSGLKRKRYFYLANIIICVFLSEVDKEEHVRIRWEEEGISYFKLANLVTSLLEIWKKRQREEEKFSKNWSLAIEEVAELWLTEFSEYKMSQKHDKVDVTRTRDNRLSFINTALKPLKEQGLIIDNSDELKIIPRPELYERLDEIYHNQKRYEDFKELINKTKREQEEKDNAQTEKD
jgi:hypothetical protein